MLTLPMLAQANLSNHSVLSDVKGMLRCVNRKQLKQNKKCGQTKREIHLLIKSLALQRTPQMTKYLRVDFITRLFQKSTPKTTFASSLPVLFLNVTCFLSPSLTCSLRDFIMSAWISLPCCAVHSREHLRSSTVTLQRQLDQNICRSKPLHG